MIKSQRAWRGESETQQRVLVRDGDDGGGEVRNLGRWMGQEMLMKR